MKLTLCKSHFTVGFSWLPRRLTLKHNPAIYGWLGYTFSFDERVGRK